MNSRAASFLLFLLVSLIGLNAPPAEARVLRGDMEVAGSPQVPYDPPYRWAYDCQAELTDRREKRGRTLKLGDEEVEYDLYAVAKFRLEPGSKFVTGQDLKWRWFALSGEDERELPKAPGDAFSTEGHSVWISFIRSEAGLEKDQVMLRASAVLPLGDYYREDSSFSLLGRGDPALLVRTEASLSRRGRFNTDAPSSLSRRLSVYCEKRE